ncbi:hypothetical protein P3T23_008443 [Paraburkholderia sp. GAS448]|uniref:hypothetical protein n=1 Tax=Paraburkholderia sp. GAS448 TaxID=3035136 RepID=UPI003D213DEE
MPKLILAVPETYDSVTRPIIYDVTRQLFSWTGLPADTPILYPSAHGTVQQPGSQRLQEPLKAELAFNDQVSVEVDETVEQDRILSTAVLYPDNLFIFRDPRVETILKPVYSSTEITINLKFRSVDEVKAKRWREQMRVRVSQLRDVLLINIRYAYQIPPAALIVLREIHRLMENVAGYGDPFGQWFSRHVTPAATIESNLAGEQMQVAFAEHQMRIVGMWDFEGAPEVGSKEDEGDTWTIGVAFRFRYDKPVSVVMDYPQMIHNQVIRLRDDTLPFNPDQVRKHWSLSAYFFEHFNKARALEGMLGGPEIIGNEGLRFPPWDEFLPTSTAPWYIRIFSAMTALDPGEGHDGGHDGTHGGAHDATHGSRRLMALDQLPEGYVMGERMRAFVAGEAPYMTKLFYSVFSCNLYLSNDIQPDGSIVVDQDLNVMTTFDPNPRARFHVWFGLCYNWRFLNPAAMARLMENFDILQSIVNGLWPDLPACCQPHAIGRSNQTSTASMACLMNGGAGAADGMLDTGMKTVETFYVQSISEDA